ncbi:unnamed protein product [Pleuronectes platessa]|uniref:Uncharacterized protein n=1 Tax=Pleuronectes platessa TaxID=8262 RepID=A0A9N7YRN9_PLEPL|nr:unnamed protein product [Pleuronectes platessa]
MQGLRPESRIVSALRSIWFPTSTLPRRQEDNQNNTRLHQKRMFHSQEPRLHNNLFQYIADAEEEDFKEGEETARGMMIGTFVFSVERRDIGQN